MSRPASEAAADMTRDSLWLLTGAPIIWAGHFLLCYVTAAIWCAKVGGGAEAFWAVRAAIAGYTVATLAGIGLFWLAGFRRIRFRPRPQNRATGADRSRFVGFVTVLLSGLSFLATLYVAMPALFIGDCR